MKKTTNILVNITDIDLSKYTSINEIAHKADVYIERYSDSEMPEAKQYIKNRIAELEAIYNDKPLDLESEDAYEYFCCKAIYNKLNK